MDSKIKKILEKMDEMNTALEKEYARLAEKYGFFFQQKKVIFLQKIRERNKGFKIPTWKYVIPKRIRHVLSLPFIYSILIPVILLDIFLTLYQWCAFSLYHIPRVKRSEYIVYDRKFLDYLNIVQKVHCLYCSYVNGFFAYAVEIGARTERYWCPIKAAHRPKVYHSWYKDFADYGSPEEWKEKFNDAEAFEKKE